MQVLMEKENLYNRTQVLQTIAQLLCEKGYMTPEELFQMHRLLKKERGA